jgi:hypothetical protein
VNVLIESKEQLTDSLHQLAADWNSTKDVWNDSARQYFEKEFWAEFETITSASILKLQELIDALAHAEREIS